jgi:hypothetical protein
MYNRGKKTQRKKMQPLTYKVFLKDGTTIEFSAYHSDMPAGPIFYASDRFDVLIWEIEHVSLIEKNED